MGLLLRLTIGDYFLQFSKLLAKRLPLLLVSVFILLTVSACGAQVGQTNWLGITADDGTFYVATGQNVVALDAEAKREVWRFPDPNDNNFSPTLLFYSTPSLLNDKVIVGDFGASGGFLSPKKITTLYSLENGERQYPPVVWSNKETPDGSIVAPINATGDQIFFATNNNSVFSVDANNGTKQWEFKTGNTVWAQPVYNDGIVYAASLDHLLHAIDAATGSEVWQFDIGGGIAGAPAVSGGRLFVPSFSGEVVALNAGDGAEIWRAEGTDWVWGTPVVDSGSVFFADADGNIYAVDEASGAMQWKQTAVGPITAALVVEGNKLIVASEGDTGLEGSGQLLTLNKDSGAILWEARTELPLYSTPVVSNGLIAVAIRAENNMMSFYDVENGSIVWTYAQNQ